MLHTNNSDRPDRPDKDKSNNIYINNGSHKLRGVYLGSGPAVFRHPKLPSESIGEGMESDELV